MGEVTIRAARIDDAVTIRAVARESWHAAYDEFLGAETVDEIIESWYALEGLRRSVAAADSRVFVAATHDASQVGGVNAVDSSRVDEDGPAPSRSVEEDEIAEDTSPSIVGFIHVGPWPDEPAELGKLVALYVRPTHWGHGVGSALLERGESALEPAFDRLRLEVFLDNDRGRRFYLDRGFERIATERESLGGDTHEVAILEKSL